MSTNDSILLNLDFVINRFKNMDSYSRGISIFKALGYPIKQIISSQNLNLNEFIYYNSDQELVFNNNELDFLSKISTISLLFIVDYNGFRENKHSFKKIYFISIEINSSSIDRSKDVYNITKIINKLYTQPVFIIFFNESNFLFSGCVQRFVEMEQGQIYLSEWYSYREIDHESIIKISSLSFGYQVQDNITELYCDMIYAISREYFIYPESKEYLTFGCLNNEYINCPLGIEDWNNNKTLQEFAEENSLYYPNIYGTDYVDNSDDIEMFINLEDEELLLSIEIVNNDTNIDGQLNADEDNESLESITNSVFEDPLELLKWLDEEDE